MEFIQYTIQWTKGEIFESAIFGAFGLISLILTILLWKFGETQNAKALIIPLLIFGLFLTIFGIFGVVNNQKRIAVFEKEFAKNQNEFVISEKKRVEDFQYLYKITNVVAPIFLVLSIVCFFLSENRYLHAIGIGLIMFGLAGFVIDYFSKERAQNYYEKIKIELQKEDTNNS